MSCLARINPVRNDVSTTVAPLASPRRREAEGFVREVFARHYGAKVNSFAPDLLLMEQQGVVQAAAGWRGAAGNPLFLESYLDQPAEQIISALAGREVRRERIVEVGNLASVQSGGGVRIMLALALRLQAQGYEWVMFTATQELIGLFARMGLPPLALAAADPSRLGDAARDWGRYYDTRPIVVAGRIGAALEKMARR